MEQTEKEFIKGFNSGYILAQHEPELMAKLAKTPKVDNNYFKGIMAGKKEYELEIVKSKLRKISPSNSNKAVSKDKGKTK